MAKENKSSSGNDDNPARRYDAAVLIAQNKDHEVTIRELAKKCQELEEDNYQLREERRQLRDKVPGDDDLVLTGEDVELWNAVKELQLDADALKKRVTEYPDLVAKAARYEKETVLRKVADVSGANFAVLRDIGSDLDYEIESKTVEVDGEKETKKVVLVKNGEDDPKTLSEYADEHWAHFKSSLFEEAEEETTETDKTPNPFEKQKRRFLGQTPSKTDDKAPSDEERAKQFSVRI